MAHPEERAVRIPDTVAGAFLQNTVRQFDNFRKQSARLEIQKRGAEHRFLALAFGMTEPRHQRPAIKHDGGIGREYQIRQTFHRRDGLDLSSRLFQAARRCAALSTAAAASAAGSACQASGRIQGLI